jgi:hypothetical protein
VSKEKLKPKIGDVFEIPLGQGSLGFGQVLSTTLVGLYALEAPERPALAEILGSPVAFRLVSMMDALAEGRWPIFGSASLPPSMQAPLRMWRRPVGGPPFLCEWKPETGTLERPSTPEEIRGLEKRVIWDSRAVVVRLQKFFRGEASAIAVIA